MWGMAKTEETKLIEKFPKGLDQEALAKVHKSIAWYGKIPWLKASVKQEHIKRLFDDLPEIMVRMRSDIARDLSEQRELSKRLPAKYVAAFESIA